jgi:hypothetical protein
MCLTLGGPYIDAVVYVFYMHIENLREAYSPLQRAGRREGIESREDRER